MSSNNHLTVEKLRIKLTLALVFLYTVVGIWGSGSYAATDHWSILALRVSFLREVPDSETTTGDGTFDLRSFEEARSSYAFPYDTPPHDRSYFEAHLQALANYYRRVSDGKVEIAVDVYPKELTASYQLRRTMISYGNGRTPEEVNRKLIELFHDSILLADAEEGENLDFSQYRSFFVFHAGVGSETTALSGIVNDIPSAYIQPEDLELYSDGPIPVDGGRLYVRDGLILPEASSQNGVGGLNGILARFFGHQLGLPGTSNFADGLPAAGGWSLMDVGSKLLGADVIGFVPCHPTAWSKIELGWIVPTVVTQDTTLQIVATDIPTDLPQAVKIPIAPEEYFLLENRQARYRPEDRPKVTFSIEDSTGVWLATDEYEAFIPGSGILIWHIDEAVTAAKRSEGAINNDPLHRGIDLEEADGYEDIGNNHVFERLQYIEGSVDDPFFVGGKTAFSSDTAPNSKTNSGRDSGLGVVVLSPPQDTMTVQISFQRNEQGWPQEAVASFGRNAPTGADLDGDGRKELVAASPDGHIHLWSIGPSGAPLHSFSFSAKDSVWSPALGDLNGDGRLEIILARQRAISCWSADGSLVWRTEIGASILTPPTLTDSGAIALGTARGVVLLNGKDGAVLLESKDSEDQSVVGIAVGDLDGDTSEDLLGTTDRGEVLLLRQGETSVIWNFGVGIPGPPVLGDLDRDGKTEAVVVSERGRVVVFRQGEIGAETKIDDQIVAPPVLGDLDGDGFLEIVLSGTGRKGPRKRWSGDSWDLSHLFLGPFPPSVFPGKTENR